MALLAITANAKVTLPKFFADNMVLQQQTGFIHLDPASYYVNTAPMELNIPIIVILNIATLLISVFVLIAPSYLVSHIHPAKSMRYE